MKLTIKYFASIREQLHTDEEIVEIDARELTVDALRGTLAARDARSGEALRMDRPVRAAVNLEANFDAVAFTKRSHLVECTANLLDRFLLRHASRQASWPIPRVHGLSPAFSSTSAVARERSSRTPREKASRCE